MVEASNKLNLIYGMFHPSVFSEAKMNIEHVMMYYHGDMLTRHNDSIFALLNIIRDNDLKNITETTFRLSLESVGRMDEEINMVVNEIKKAKSYTKDQVSPYKDWLRGICYQAALATAKVDFEGDPVGMIEKIKDFQYQSNFGDEFNTISFADLDITDILKNLLEKSVKSKFPFINEAYPIKAIPNGQVILVVGAPGTGKSFYLMSETDNFVQQGLRVHYTALGDLNHMDFLTRLASIAFKKDLSHVTVNITQYIPLIKERIGDKLGVMCAAAGKMTPKMYLEYVDRIIDDYDIFIIDYDSNFAKSGDNMYHEGGEIYDALTELSRKGKLVFAASQPKQHYWGDDWLPLDSAGESSRKQQIVDMILTIGRSVDSGSRCGYFNIPKNRRGKVNVQSAYLCSNDGDFNPITEELYGSISGNRIPKEYTRNEIFLMEEQILIAKQDVAG